MDNNINTIYSWTDPYWRRHPFKCIHKRWQAKRQRIRRGWCEVDELNFCDWFLTVVPDMLRELAGAELEHNAGLTNSIVEKLADDLTLCEWHNFVKQNEFAAKARKAYARAQFQNGKVQYASEEDKEICDRYDAREQELEKERQELIEDCFARLAKYFDYLWE